ncbi:MAG: hypothetical protein KC561_18285, partial [Myxococcales bacterium]|nr:hypothetical protein [Myxococcales bacterium]
MKNANPILLVCLVGFLMGGLAATGIAVFADDNPATESLPRLLPYHGLLEIDGLPADGVFSMRFSLYDGSGSRTWQE